MNTAAIGECYSTCGLVCLLPSVYTLITSRKRGVSPDFAGLDFGCVLACSARRTRGVPSDFASVYVWPFVVYTPLVKQQSLSGT